MSDEQPHEAGSRRRRREIREARERAAGAEREREEALRRRRLSFDQTLSRDEGEQTSGEVFDQTVYDQESSGSKPAQPVRPAATPAEPFESVVSPHRAASPTDAQEEEAVAEAQEDRPRDFLDDLEGEGLVEEHIEHDEDGTPLLISSSSYGRGYQTVTPVDSDVGRTVLQRRRQRRRRRNLTLAAALAGFTVLVIGFVWAVGAFLGGRGPEDYDQVAGDTVEFTVSEGDVPDAIFSRLVDQEIVASEEALTEAWQEWQAAGGDDLLRTGDFALNEEMPAEDAIAAIFDGEEASHYFSINSGVRIDDALDAIAENTGIDRRELSEISDNPQQLGLPEEAETLEGYLAVGEYNPPVDATAEDVLREPVERTFEQLEELGIEEDEQFEAITKASLVTAESHYDADGGDYSTIAGAIENRLDELGDEDSETEGYLQIDAAVIYGLGTQQIHFTDEEREDSGNEYNTYQHPGLTPGPIEAPHPDALAAVADPDENDYLYWVTVDLETGETLFAETYSEHQENVERLNEYCAENSEICSGEPAEQAEAVEPGE